jgi:hypothetical protein
LFVTPNQLVVARPELPCRTNPAAEDQFGHVNTNVPLVQFRVKTGLACQAQIPPGDDAAAILLPSAEEASEVQYEAGKLRDVQLAPASVER